MQAHRRGTDLKIDITLALASLGQPYKLATKGMSIVDMTKMLADLRRQQLDRGIIKSQVVRAG